MKLINYLLIVLVFVSSCKEENEPVPTFAKDYGDGMYIVTENGVSFYDGEVVKNQIYKEVNGATLSNPKKIKFKGVSIKLIGPTSISENNIKSFDIYPNPATEQITINITSNIINNLTATIYSITGQTILEKEVSSTSTVINTANLAKGYYILKLSNKKGSSVSIRKNLIIK